MNPPKSLHSGNGRNNDVRQVFPASVVRRLEHAASQQAADLVPDAPETRAGDAKIRYGLPCAKCRSYYGADLLACPICNSTRKLSTRNARESDKAQEESPEIVQKQERDRIQAELDSHFRSSRGQSAENKKQISPASIHRCTLPENHPGGEQPAVVCRSCYDRLQGRLDFMEAVLHIDLKEAARIVYDAVWADPHSGKTYENAAQALLAALKRRAGISLEPFQRFPH